MVSSSHELNNFTFAWLFLLSDLIQFPMNNTEMYLVSSSRSQKGSSHCTPASPALTKTSSVGLILFEHWGQSLFEAKFIYLCFGFSIFLIEYLKVQPFGCVSGSRWAAGPLDILVGQSAAAWPIKISSMA